MEVSTNISTRNRVNGEGILFRKLDRFCSYQSVKIVSAQYKFVLCSGCTINNINVVCYTEKQSGRSPIARHPSPSMKGLSHRAVEKDNVDACR
jgi:hypothetical protein